MADKKFYVDVVVPDEAYDATGWNGDLSVPTKNAVRDKIESIPALTDGDKGDIVVSSSGTVWNLDSTITGSKSFTGSVSAANINVTGTNTAINLNGSASNTVIWNVNGQNPPAFTTRSAGTKLVLYPSISGVAVDTAIGTNGSGVMWQSIATAGAGAFYWYAGTTQIASMTGAGDFSVTGGMAGDYFAAAAGGSGSPSLSVDSTNGLYSPSANVLGISAGNVSRIVINSTSISNTLPLYGQDGSNTAPTYAFTSSTGTGMYLSGTNTIGLGTNSTLRVSISTSAVTSTLPYLSPNGSLSNVAFGFSGDPNTGMYQTGTADTIALVTGGNPVLTLTAAREARINDQFDIEVMNWMNAI